MTKHETEPAIKISHSQVLTWLSCKWKWKWAYLDRWTSKEKSHYLTQGNMMHELLAMYYSGKQNEVMPKLHEWANEPDKWQLVEKCAKLYTRYTEEFAPREDAGWTTLAAEYYFSIVLRTPVGIPFELEGYVDQIKVKNGSIFVEDYKTHTARPWTDDMVQMDSQLPVYGAALKELGYTVNGVSILLLNMYDYKEQQPIEKMVKRIRHAPSQTEFSNILYQFGLAVDEILFYRGMNENRYVKNLKKDCSQCQFQMPCLMDNKGIDATPFLMTNFEQRSKRESETLANEELNI